GPPSRIPQINRSGFRAFSCVFLFALPRNGAALFLHHPGTGVTIDGCHQPCEIGARRPPGLSVFRHMSLETLGDFPQGTLDLVHFVAGNSRRVEPTFSDPVRRARFSGNRVPCPTTGNAAAGWGRNTMKYAPQLLEQFLLLL